MASAVQFSDVKLLEDASCRLQTHTGRSSLSFPKRPPECFVRDDCDLVCRASLEPTADALRWRKRLEQERKEIAEVIKQCQNQDPAGMVVPTVQFRSAQCRVAQFRSALTRTAL